MQLSKVLLSNPSLRASAQQSYASGAAPTASAYYDDNNDALNSELQSRPPRRQIGFLELLKEVFLNGFLEKALAGLMIYETYGHHQAHLPKSNFLKLGATFFGALAIGELFIRLEEAIENWANNTFNSGPDSLAERHPSDWTWNTLLSKGISVGILAAIASAKKMYMLGGPMAQSSMGKAALDGALQGLSRTFGLTYQKENVLNGSNLIDCFHKAGEWMHTETRSKGPLVKAAGNTASFFFKRIIGCPSIREANLKGQKASFGALAGDFGVKVAVMAPLLLASKFLVDQLHRLFEKKDTTQVEGADMQTIG